MFNKRKQSKPRPIGDRVEIEMMLSISLQELSQELKKQHRCIKKLSGVRDGRTGRTLVVIDFLEFYGTSEKQAVINACENNHTGSAA